MFPRLFCAIVASLCAISTAFRDVEVAPNKVFAAYEEGFVGQSDDPRNLLRERINEGAHDSTAKPISQAAVATQICPGMVGPFTGDLYYCTGKEFGYCDRRNGVCFCNVGYTGLDCSQCTPTHFKIGHLCYPKKLCPNACSGGGVCDYYTGKCNCDVGRVGEDCSETLCSSYDINCEDCTSMHCVRCAFGFSLALGRCEPCHRFDPRCVDCNAQECLECADMVLLSIQRSGRRPGVDPELPFDEVNRSYSQTFAFGSQDPRYFDEAEAYFVARGPKQTPLNQATMSCAQGTTMDASWSCAAAPASNVVCGHMGRFTFSSPTYTTNEDAGHVRITIRRSGGGVGEASVSYALTHITTSPSDVASTAAYTTVQTVHFEPGVIEKTLLLSIFDDNEVEGDETFQLSLRNPSKWSDTGNTREAIVTIRDNDSLQHTSPQQSVLSSPSTTNAAGAVTTLQVQAFDALGNAQQLGGDLFYAFLVNEMSLLSYQEPAQPLHLFEDLGDGSYQLDVALGLQGISYARVFQLHAGGWSGEYFSDSWMLNSTFIRVDRYINFTWNDGVVDGKQPDYVSIRWTGVLTAPITSEYTFVVECDDHARLLVDGVVRIDAWDAISAPVTQSHTVTWEAGSLHKVQLEYRELLGDAFVRLRWLHDGVSQLSDIPSDVVHFESELSTSPLQLTTVSGPTDAARTECTGDGLFRCTVGKVSHFRICPKDQFGNARDDSTAFHLQQEAFDARLTLESAVIDYEVSATVAFDANTACFQASYVVDVAGIYRLDVKMRDPEDNSMVPVYGSPFMVVAKPGDSLGTTSRIYNLASHTVAGVPLVFEIQVRDLNGNLKNQGSDTVEVYALHQASHTSEYGWVTDNGNGNYSVGIMLPRTGLYDLFVELNGVLVDNTPTGISVSSNIPHHSTSTCQIDPLGRVGFDLAARIVLRDEWANALTQPPSAYNLTTQLSGKYSLLDGHPTHLGAGQWAVTFVPEDVGPTVLVVRVNGQVFCNGSAIAEVLDGTGSSALSFVYGAGLHSAVAGHSAVFYIQAVDAHGHRRQADGDIFNVSIVGPALIDSRVSYAGSGVYEVAYTPKVSGWYNVTVYLIDEAGGSMLVPVPQAPQLYVLPTLPIAHMSKLLHADADVEAGQASAVSVHLNDSFGNPLEFGGELVQTEWFHSNGRLAATPAFAADHGDGGYTTVWTPTKTDKYTVVTSVAEHALAATIYEGKTTEHVIRSFVDAAPLQLSASVFPTVINGTSLPTTEFWITWEGWILPPFREPFEFSVEVDAYSSVLIQIGDHIVCDTGSGTSASAVFMFESLDPHPLLVQYRHGQYETSLDIRWRSRSFPEQPIGVAQLRTYQNISVTLTDVSCSSVCASCTLAEGLALEEAIAGVPARFMVDARDRFNNHITHFGQSVNVTLVLNGQAEETGIVLEEEAGSFEITYTARKAGTYQMYVTIGCCAPDPVADGFAAFLEFVAANGVQGSPFTVVVHPGHAYGAATFATGSALNSSVAGVNSTIILHMRDSQENPTSDYDLSLLDIRTIIHGNEYAPAWQHSRIESRVFCMYTIYTAGTYSLELYYNSSGVQGGPYELVVMPAKASPAFTRPYGHHLTAAQVGMPVYFRLESVDAFMNPLTFGGHRFFIRLYGAETIIPAFDDEENGWYRVNYTVPSHPGIYDVHVLLLSIASVGMHGDGVLVQYFESPLLEGAPMMTRVEDRVTLSGDGNITRMLPEKVRSVRWSGYLYIPLNDLFVFTLETDQRVNFYMDDQLIFHSGANAAQSPPLRLLGGASYRVKLEMFIAISDAPASIEWFWEAALTNRATVPKRYLHSQATPIAGSPYRLTATLSRNV